MIFKKILRYLTVACLAIVTIFLISSHKTKAEDTSKLLDSKAVQKIVKRGTLNVGVTILLRPIATKVWKLILLKRLLMS